ncbi:unnamed protein product [Urochloa decumbens]|uniref:F-box domain-containing protein n=1 Tax=Urochloa decumbens TaxID=240449 RepID=A0ABC9FLX7_9POAL
MAPATELLDELIEEIFFRIHPADPTTLARAALVCRRWCRLIADPGFRRRLHEFHRVPHMLGYSCNTDEGFDRYWFYGNPSRAALFVRTSSSLKRVDMERTRVLDTRHGRVLLLQPGCYLCVWDPITKEHKRIGMSLPNYPESWNAAVLCTAAGCNHLDCHGKPYAVVLIATTRDLIITNRIKEMRNSIYSSEATRWSETHSFVQQPENHLDLERSSPSALVGNALYFVLKRKAKILEYNVSTREIHTINLPPACFLGRRIMLMATEDGSLGFATVCDSKLCLWSTADKDVGWTRSRVIDLEALLPTRALKSPADVVGFAHGVGFFFIKTDYKGHFKIDIKSNRVKKIRPVYGSNIFPYMSFHTPALGAVAANTCEGSSMGASSA